jgi:prepilin-type N-terminal cleavage/methylation domain-containing protein
MNVARPRSTQGRRSSGGFTLLEIVVAVFVFSLVITVVYSTWTVILKSNGTALKATASAQRARMAVRTIEDALSSALMFPTRNGEYAFIADTTGASGALSFAADLSDSFPGSGLFGGERVRRVTLMVDPGKRALLLQQSSIFANFDRGGGPSDFVLAHDVSEFRLEFWGPLQNNQNAEAEYATEWLSTNTLPQLVRVTIGFGQTRGNQPAEVVTRVVRLPTSAVQATALGGPGIGGGAR